MQNCKEFMFYYVKIVPVGVNSVWFEMMSPWGWTQIKSSKHVGQWNYTINVIKLYICRTINIDNKVLYKQHMHIDMSK
jgi:hypothetical protein